MRKTTLKSFCAAIPFIFAGASASAADVNLSGFATITAGSTTSSEELYDGYTSDLDFNQDSLFALQISSDLGDGLSVTAQLIARGEDDWEPAFEWAFLGYDISDNWRILAGRQRVPFFMYSDFLDVSYAYHWISPPNSVYSLPFDTFDGIGAIYSSQIGSVDSTVHFIAGRNQEELLLETGEMGQPDFKNIVGAAWTLSGEWLTVRAALFQAEMTLDVPQLTPLSQGWINAGYSDIGANIIADKDDILFGEVGFQIDYNDFLVVAEYTHLDLENTGQPDQDSYYVSLGKRFDSVMFHVTAGADDDVQANMMGNVSDNPAFDGLKAATAGVIASNKLENKYLTVGFNWDFHDLSTFKFEVTQFDDNIRDVNDATLVKLALTTVF